MEQVLETLNPQQKDAVMATEGPVLVLAGAGSGKTRVLTTRIAYLILEKKIAPWHILSMTFTNKAAREMKERVERLVGENSGLWVGTFHSTFANILRSEATAFGFSSSFGIYDADDQVRLIKSIMEQNHLPVNQFAPKSIASVISKNKNSLTTPEQYQATVGSPFEEVVALVYPLYQKQLRINQVFDFDDLITRPIQLFQEYPNVLEKYRERFNYLLVDEYQDTNHAQYTLVKQLAEIHQNLCVVGDDDQSIYGWRGADIRNILDFEKDFKNTRTFRLEQNYRSTQNILKAASSVVARNQGRKGKTLWSDREEGEKITLIETLDEKQESARIVEFISSEVMKKKRSFKDFAVLYRTNAQSRAIEDGLRRSGMSYIIIGGVRFYERKEIKDVLSYLKVITNPNDTVSLKRIINFPTRGIGDVSMTRVETWAAQNGRQLFEALGEIESVPNLAERAKRAIRGFVDIIRKYQDFLDKLSANELVHTLLEDIGLIQYYKQDLTIESQGRLENIREFLNAIQEYVESDEEVNLTGFLEEVALVSDIDAYNDQSNAITLMTLHTAKGLEFPVVFIPGMEENLFPVMRSLESPAAIEEERRLFYVGLTRAREKIYLLHASRRNQWGGESFRMPSRFLKETDASVVERVEPPRPEQNREPQRSYTRKFERAAGRDPHPDYESYSQEADDTALMRGMWVRHQIFGRGQITGTEGRGKNMRITVRFERGMTKKFIAQYANFELD